MNYAMQNAIYDYTQGINNSALLKYRNEHMPKFEKLQWLIQQENLNTIAGAYNCKQV